MVKLTKRGGGNKTRNWVHRVNSHKEMGEKGKDSTLQGGLRARIRNEGLTEGKGRKKVAPKAG